MALVTGATGHIGKTACQTLLELGASVGVLDVDKRQCEETIATLSPIKGARAIAVPCDLRDEAATRAAVRSVVERGGGLDILIHCAAYVGTSTVSGWSVPFEQQTVAAWDEAMKINLTAAFVMAQEAKEALTASGHGTIVFVASTYGVCGPDFRLYEGTAMANPVGYGASKGGLLQLMRYLASLLAPRVRVNAISPGGLWRGQPQVFVDRYEARTPLGRMAKEEDMKGAVAYLASDLSAYVTGHNLLVDGGWTAW